MGWQDAPLDEAEPGSAPAKAPAAELPKGKWQAAPEVSESAPGKPFPATAGASNFLASIAGIPGDLLENLANLGIAGYGTAKGVVTGDPGSSPQPLAPGALGGTEFMRQKLRQLAEATGVQGFRPDNPNPGDPVSTAQYDFVSRGGVLPGGAIPAAASIVAEKTLGPQWAGVGAMVPSAAVSAYNAMRAPALQKLQQQNTVRDATLREAQDAGYVVVPSQINPSFVGNRAEGVAGKAALNQDAVLRNQRVTNDLARKAVGLPENIPLTQGNLEVRRVELSAPYREVSSLSPLAKQALEKLREARSEAKTYWQHYDRTATPESQKAAIRWDQRAEIADRVIEHQAARAGKPELVAELRQARTNIAKTYDVERALNLADGNVDARILGRALDRGAPLTGELATIAKFSEAFPQLTRAVAGNPTPGVTALESRLAALFGIGGHAALGPGGLALAALPLAGPATRSVLLSQPYQRNFARPDYGPAMRPEDPLQSLFRQTVISEGQ